MALPLLNFLTNLREKGEMRKGEWGAHGEQKSAGRVDIHTLAFMHASMCRKCDERLVTGMAGLYVGLCLCACVLEGGLS